MLVFVFSTIKFSPLGNSDHAVVSPINSKQYAPLHPIVMTVLVLIGMVFVFI